MRLNNLSDNPGAHKTRIRIGRGIGTGKGKTGGRGGKGQTARAGVAIGGFEGGQMPLHMRMPKRGFNAYKPGRYNAIRLDRIQDAITAGRLPTEGVVDAQALVAAGVIRRPLDGVRLIAGPGAFSAKVQFSVVHASKGAQAAIEAAGGKVDMLQAQTSAEA